MGHAARPGIDRSASAWLIRHFIDKKAQFTFAQDGDVPADAVPFDMFQGGSRSMTQVLTKLLDRERVILAEWPGLNGARRSLAAQTYLFSLIGLGELASS